MVICLAHQLAAWIDHARDFGYMTKNFKFESGVLSSNLKKFLTIFEATDDEMYEYSVQVSDLVERIAKMDEGQIKRVAGLINKIERTPSKSVADVENV